MNYGSGDDKAQWLIALGNVKFFYTNLYKDLKAVASSLRSSVNDAETPNPQFRSIEDVKLEYEKLTMEYYQKPGVWSTGNLLKDEKGVVPTYAQTLRTLSDSIENDESPYSSQYTNPAPSVSGKDSDELPPPGSIGSSFFDEAFPDAPPASQSSALVLTTLPALPDDAVTPAGPSQNSSQLSSSYGSSWTVSTIPTPDRDEDRSTSFANPAQSLPALANNAVERGSSPSNYNCYSHLEAPLSNHIEMPSSSGIRAFPSQPYNHMKTAPITYNKGIPCSSPTEIRPYYKSSNNNIEMKLSRPKGALDNPASPPYLHVRLDPEFSKYHDCYKNGEDFSTLQSYLEPLLYDHGVGTQPAFNSAQFGQPQQPRSNRGTQTSPEPLPLGDQVHSQPALSAAQIFYPQTPHVSPSSRAIPPGPEPPPLKNWVQNQPTFSDAIQVYSESLPFKDWVQSDPTFSCDAVQPYAEPLPFDDWAQRQSSLHSSQFDNTRPLRPAFSCNDIHSYVEALPYDGRFEGEQGLESIQFEHPSNRAIQPDPEPLPSGHRLQRQSALNGAQFQQERQIPAMDDDLTRLGVFNRRSQPYLEQTACERSLLDPLQPPRRAAATAPANHVPRMSNNTQGNSSPA